MEEKRRKLLVLSLLAPNAKPNWVWGHSYFGSGGGSARERKKVVVWKEKMKERGRRSLLLYLLAPTANPK